MIKRFQTTIQPILHFLEAGLMGLFFVQAMRMLVGDLYSHIQSASLFDSYTLREIEFDTSVSGVILPSTVSNEIILLGVMLALPVLLLLLGRVRFMFIVAVGLGAFGRAAMTIPDTGISSTMGAILAVGGGLIYILLLVSQRATKFPYFFILGFAADQMIRAFGSTSDPTWTSQFANPQLALSVTVVVLALINTFRKPQIERSQLSDGTRIDLNKGKLTIWGAIGLGGLLFLEFSLLALPNTIMGRSGTELYTVFVPLVLAATLLPLIPTVRSQARQLIAPFAPNTRGWIWLIFMALLLVFGTRLTQITIAISGGAAVTPIGGILLGICQFAASMIWWWFVRPKTENEHNFGGLWLVLSMLIFALFVGVDIFTYDYAFVQQLAAPLDRLNNVIPPLLRGLRGMGLALILFAAFLSTLPMIQSTRRIPWSGAKPIISLIVLVIVAVATAGSYRLSLPPQVLPVVNVDRIRVGTWNIHGGYSEFFAYSLEDVAVTIYESGADVVLLQEVEAGRLTSYGVDQSLWLARRISAIAISQGDNRGMDKRFFAANEGLQGLAVLSRVPIAFDDGELLNSIESETGRFIGQQTALQRVQIIPDNGPVTIYNTSLGVLLQSSEQSVQENNQEQQLSQILDIIARHVEDDYGQQLGRALLGGTFNNVPSSPLIQRMYDTPFIDPFAGTNLTLSATLRRANLPPARYDYLWLWSQTLQPSGTNVMNDRPAHAASDHRLAVVEIIIRQ
ncbi:MAG: endonuclease/exonuclease/phosphatase family protein [Anaerolineae bacterium]|nr:endonuclease/exonuclease/phosphatase family protein [Anaerolineae bacterium]